MSSTMTPEFGTSAKEIEKKLRHSEFRLKQAQAIAHIGSWEHDLSTGISEWSEETCRIYGVDPDERYQTFETWLSFSHPDDLDYVCTLSREGYAKSENFHFYHRIIRRDGIVRYIFTKAQFDFDDNGRPTYIYGIAHDVTETKEAELALAQSEANLRLIVDLIPQAIFAKDGEGNFLFVNKSFADIYGLTPNQMISRPISDLIPDKQEAVHFLKQGMDVITSNETKSLRSREFTDDKGNKRIFDIIKVPFTAIGEISQAVLGIATEVTEQRQAETERTKMIAEIIHRNKILEQFTYIVSHNLRAPVANIIGMTQLMQTAELDECDEKEFVRELGHAAMKLDNVVLDLNEILQVDKRHNKKTEDVVLPDLLDDLEMEFECMMHNESVSIVTDFSEVDRVVTLRGYLHSIFFNLISNSIKYKKPGIDTVIEISAKRIGNTLKIVFRDNGMGIDLERNGNKVFGLYKRFHPDIDGKGMGLFMVRTQVELLGGHIDIASEVNKGTEFTIYLEMK